MANREKVSFRGKVSASNTTPLLRGQGKITRFFKVLTRKQAKITPNRPTHI